MHFEYHQASILGHALSEVARVSKSSLFCSEDAWRMFSHVPVYNICTMNLYMYILYSLADEYIFLSLFSVNSVSKQVFLCCPCLCLVIRRCRTAFYVPSSLVLFRVSRFIIYIAYGCLHQRRQRKKMTIN